MIAVVYHLIINGQGHNEMITVKRALILDNQLDLSHKPMTKMRGYESVPDL